MLKDSQYKKVDNSDIISKMKKQISLLQGLGALSTGIVSSLKSIEETSGVDIVKEIWNTNRFIGDSFDTEDLECVIHFKTLSPEQNDKVWEIAKDAWMYQQKPNKNKLCVYVGTDYSGAEIIDYSKSIESEPITFISIFFKRQMNKFSNQERYEVSQILNKK
jgi:hypothetical protein